MLREYLAASVVPVCPLTAEQISLFEQHFALLERWNARLNLTRIIDESEAAIRHYGESAFLARWLPGGRLRIADLGSGAGFPGIPLAVLRPDCSVCLIESHQRKAVFLREAARHLTNVRVLAVRAENVGERFDWVVCRAVAWREILRYVFQLAPRVALFGGEEQIPGEECRVPLPWGDHRYLVSVSRETSPS